MVMNFEWLKHPLHTRAPAGGEVGVDGRCYKGGEFEPFYVPRPVMPQIDEADIPELVKFIRQQGVEVKMATVEPECLLFHQRVDMKKVHTIDDEVMQKPLLIAMDHYILDGNHRGAAHKLQQKPALCWKVMATFIEALGLLYAFPKTYEYGDGNFHPVRN